MVAHVNRRPVTCWNWKLQSCTWPCTAAAVVHQGHTFADVQVEVPKVQTAVNSIVGAGPFLTGYQQQVSSGGLAQGQNGSTLCKICCRSLLSLQQ